jgi:hypothetical protein
MGTPTAALAVRNPEKLPADDLAVLAGVALTHERVGHTEQGLWHHKGMQLPAYIQHIANDLIQQKAMTESRAIATAVSRCKVWCAGGDNVKADTKAKACAAVAEWEALKVKSRSENALHKDTKAAGVAFAVGPKGYTHGWIKVGGFVKTPEGHKGKVIGKPGDGQVHVEHGGEVTSYHEDALQPHVPPADLIEHMDMHEANKNARQIQTLQDQIHRAELIANDPQVDESEHEFQRKRLVKMRQRLAKLISTKAATVTRGSGGWAVQAKPAEGFNPSLHPRKPKGPGGGQFAPGGGGGSTPTNENPVQNGMSGKQVSDLQARLNALGANLKVDGKFGPKTEAAVREFQRTHKDAQGRPLKVDGLVGPLTTGALRMKPGAKPKAPRKPPRVGSPTSPKNAAAVPALVTVPGVDLLAAGTWELSSGRQTFTRKDITDAIEASKCPAVGNPVIKLGHLDPRFNDTQAADAGEMDGQPAIGQVTNLRADESGSKLVGDLSGMPGWLAQISASAFPRRSVEGSYGFRCQIGHTHPFVLTGLALLGVTAPGVGVLNSLPDVASLYGVHDPVAAAQERPWQFTVEEGDGVMAITEEDVRRAYYATGAPADWWITELQMQPAQLIVAGSDGKVYRVNYQIEGPDTISFGQPEPLESYAQVAAARGTGPSVTFASAGDSRSVVDDEDDEDEGTDDDVTAAGTNGWVQRDGEWVYDPDGDGDDDSTAEGDTDNSHFGTDGKLKPGITIPPKPKTASDGGATPAPASQGAVHEPMTGTHAHPHPAYGSQGGDQTHGHSHSHKGDNNHAHAHAGAGRNREGGSDVELTDEQINSLRDSLGVGPDEELDGDKLVSAAAALKSSKTVRGGKGSLPPGVIAIEQEVWDAVNRKVEASERFRAKVLRDERDEVIDAAVRAGKFSASRVSHWVRLWDADPDGTREIIGSLTKNVVPVEDKGGPGGSLDDDAYESEFASLYPPGTPGFSRTGK